jgi:NADPH:quinone reductase-like Zn-dependent oxidoreductase
MGGGFLKPKKNIPGIDMAGKVEQVGKNVAEFKVGDNVFGDVYQSATGAFAEYVCVKEGATIVKKPKGVTFVQAASTPVAGLTALQALRDHGNVQKGQEVLINGASGGVGTFAVILAKAFGAQVTGVCSTKNVELIKSIGADIVIDYTKQDISKLGKRYDLIIDIAANIYAKGYKQMLEPKGKGILVGFSSALHMVGVILKSKKLLKKHGIIVKSMGGAKTNMEDLKYLGELIESCKITPAIDRVYPLEQTTEAMRYFEEEHAKAKVVITIE